jgi:hypothetical protein
LVSSEYETLKARVLSEIETLIRWCPLDSTTSQVPVFAKGSCTRAAVLLCHRVYKFTILCHLRLCFMEGEGGTARKKEDYRGTAVGDHCCLFVFVLYYPKVHHLNARTIKGSNHNLTTTPQFEETKLILGPFKVFFIIWEAFTIFWALWKDLKILAFCNG